MVKKMTLMKKQNLRKTQQHEIFYHHLQEWKDTVQKLEEEKSKNILKKG